LYDFNPVLDILMKERFRLILANDLDSLPFASIIANANGAKLVLDTHEYAPRHFEDQWTWRFFFQEFNKYLCKTYLKRCDEIITVTDGIAAQYKADYGIDPIVITNAVDYVELNPTLVDNDHIRIITHGIAHPNRRLELMVSIMDYTDKRFHLDFMLLPVFPRYYKKLQSMAAKRSNVKIIPPVSREEIIPFTNSYDISFLIFKPYTINYKYGLGSKTFESLQARLALVTGPSPEPQAEIVNKYGCGIVVPNFEERVIAALLNRLTKEQIQEYKRKAGIAAHELTADKNMEILGGIVSKCLRRPETFL
jgi:glycosyltransferase involved in cell wall biosynthesis